MAYKIIFTHSARKSFDALPIPDQDKLEKKIDKLSQNPRPDGVKKLSGTEGLYRIRSGDYRVIYQIQDKMLLVLVVKVGHRRDVYR